jgi:hypothetical protein
VATNNLPKVLWVESCGRDTHDDLTILSIHGCGTVRVVLSNVVKSGTLKSSTESFERGIQLARFDTTFASDLLKKRSKHCKVYRGSAGKLPAMVNVRAEYLFDMVETDDLASLRVQVFTIRDFSVLGDQNLGEGM